MEISLKLSYEKNNYKLIFLISFSGVRRYILNEMNEIMEVNEMDHLFLFLMHNSFSVTSNLDIIIPY